MTERLAYAYVRVLFLLELLLFATSLLLHLNVFFKGESSAYATYGAPLFRASVLVCVPAFAFVSSKETWTDQIRSCPKWMWRGSLILGLYTILIACLQPASSGSAMPMSSFPLALEAISLCVLYSVSRSGYLDKPEVVTRTLHSLVFVILTAIVFTAYRSGYFHHPAVN
jgi:hypothetical protein